VLEVLHEGRKLLQVHPDLLLQPSHPVDTLAISLLLLCFTTKLVMTVAILRTRDRGGGKGG
jgi:hypothetical protein